ncbi:MAG: site-specific DNA-methyltransferase [Endomicrobium sp.]|jgi:site-specific DNA-methyltransferase (adenine-specific)|nr:site-specific DNA-methyltransferase [Endomicrobium sp.]
MNARKKTKKLGLNPFFEFNNAVLYRGNVLEANTFENNFCDLIVTSPPYNVGIEYNSNEDLLNYNDYLAFTEQWLKNCYYWTKDSGRLILNIPLDKSKGGQKSVGADITTIAQKVGWKYHSTIIWNEGNISRRTAWGSFMSASAPYVIAPVELVIVLYKKEWKKIGGSKISDITKKDFMNWTNGVWTFNGESKKRIGHPAPFPKELPYRAIKLFSYVNDVVFDPFSGSGTTILVAAMNNRTGIGLEIDLDYCKLAKKRLLYELNTFGLDKFDEKNIAKQIG